VVVLLVSVPPPPPVPCVCGAAPVRPISECAQVLVPFSVSVVDWVWAGMTVLRQFLPGMSPPAPPVQETGRAVLRPRAEMGRTATGAAPPHGLWGKK